MLIDRLLATYLLVSLGTFVHSCNNNLFSDVTSMLVMSLFSAFIWPIYWTLAFFDVENPTAFIWYGWFIIVTILMGIFIAYDKVTRMWRK